MAEERAQLCKAQRASVDAQFRDLIDNLIQNFIPSNSDNYAFVSSIDGLKQVAAKLQELRTQTNESIYTPTAVRREEERLRNEALIAEPDDASSSSSSSSFPAPKEPPPEPHAAGGVTRYRKVFAKKRK